MKKFVVAMIATLVLVGVAYGAVRIFAALSPGYTWKETDWNQDGNTTLSELFQSSDIGKRTVMKDSRTCAEYFRMKDGMPIRIDCPSG